MPGSPALARLRNRGGAVWSVGRRYAAGALRLEGVWGTGQRQPRVAHYGVKLVRGPFVRLAAHPQACEDEDEFLSYAARLRAGGRRIWQRIFSVAAVV